jgi:hypothetical protein
MGNQMHLNYLDALAEHVAHLGGEMKTFLVWSHSG